MALVRLFFDSGLRLAEMAGLRLDDLDLKERSVTVLGKGGRRHRDLRDQDGDGPRPV